MPRGPLFFFLLAPIFFSVLERSLGPGNPFLFPIWWTQSLSQKKGREEDRKERGREEHRARGREEERK